MNEPRTSTEDHLALNHDRRTGEALTDQAIRLLKERDEARRKNENLTKENYKLHQELQRKLC